MTCGEFEHRAATLTLRELPQMQDQQIRGHAAECQKCAAWLQQQRTLAATMQTLHAQTAACAAGPEVERALLQAFRQRSSQPANPEMTHYFTPIAIRLSRFFEVGAYVAVGAAVVVALFLGVRLLEQRSVNVPAKSQVAQPSITVPSVVAGKFESQPAPQLPVVSRTGTHRTLTRRVASAIVSSSDAVEPSQTGTDEDYVALMFCDPLSCSSDSQVVRMELPASGVAAANGAQDAQMRVADVVVGYDGVVRAVRIVN